MRAVSESEDGEREVLFLQIGPIRSEKTITPARAFSRLWRLKIQTGRPARAGSPTAKNPIPT